MPLRSIMILVPVSVSRITVADYSPDCFQNGRSYRTILCKAQGNTGMRAAISFETEGVFEKALFFVWLLVSLVILGLIALFDMLARYVVEIYSDEVSHLLFEGVRPRSSSWLSRMAQTTLEKFGISNRISEQTARFRTELEAFEKKIEREAATRSRLEQEAISSQEYVEKVKQIRHDIRSPLSSLQAIYEKLKTNEVTTTKALATVIRRIQLLMDDLNQIDKVREEAKLVVAEVAVEEIALVMQGKFHDAKSVSLTLDYKKEALSPIKVGEKEFQSVIENLLENAFEAVSFGGHVKIQIHNKMGRCQIVVEDDGYGISKENLAKLLRMAVPSASSMVLAWDFITQKRTLNPGVARLNVSPLSVVRAL